jgi:hypothetical protein
MQVFCRSGMFRSPNMFRPCHGMLQISLSYPCPRGFDLRPALTAPRTRQRSLRKWL